jgi:hypothetical protein
MFLVNDESNSFLLPTDLDITIAKDEYEDDDDVGFDLYEVG